MHPISAGVPQNRTDHVRVARAGLIMGLLMAGMAPDMGVRADSAGSAAGFPPTQSATHIWLSSKDSGSLATTFPVYRSPRPRIRPAHIGKLATASALARLPSSATPATGSDAGATSGGICGDRRIRGKRVSPIPGKLPGCGVDRPVSVTAVDGVRLSVPATIDCETAKSLRSWVSNTVKPTYRRRGGGVQSLTVAAHYACRTRNSRPGAKISEHGKGHAIDISAINFRDGSRVTVKDGWRVRRERRRLSKLHSGACGPFGTVLGPNSDRYHKDHFHLDTARYRGGPYCR